MTSRRKKPERERDPLAPYRRLRRPMPPPQKAIPDRRRELEEEQARRELEEGVWGAQGASADSRAEAPQEEEGVRGAQGAGADARAVAPKEEEGVRGAQGAGADARAVAPREEQER